MHDIPAALAASPIAQSHDLRPEIQHEAERLALIRELEEKGELYTFTLSTLEGVQLGFPYLYFKNTEGRSWPFQVLEINHETNEVKTRIVMEEEAAKIGIPLTRQQRRHAERQAAKKARRRAR